VSGCDHEASKMRRPWSTRCCCAIRERVETIHYSFKYTYSGYLALQTNVDCHILAGELDDRKVSS